MQQRLQKYGFAAMFVAGMLMSESCSMQDATPGDLLTESEMTSVLTDVYVAEVQSMVRYDLKMRKDRYIKYYVYPVVFEQHNVTDSMFYRTYRWYEAHPGRFEVLMDSVIARMERLPIDTAAVLPEGRNMKDALKEMRVIEQQNVRNRQRTEDALR